MYNRSVLVLNSDYSPLHVCNVRRAIRLLLAQKVDVLKSTDESIGSQSVDMKIPSVIRLRYYINRPFQQVTLTRQNIHIRDNHMCQYCGSKDRLTLDHIIPRKRGGQSTWENLVCSCFRCNNKKADQTLEQSGLVLKSKPKRPTFAMMFKYTNTKNEAWEDFLPN